MFICVVACVTFLADHGVKETLRHNSHCVLVAFYDGKCRDNSAFNVGIDTCQFIFTSRDLQP